MTLYLTKEASEGIARHGEEGYPDEICGLLIGRDEASGRVVRALVPVVNEFEVGEQYHRFLITPDAMFRADRLARKTGLDVLGIYHSHPNEEARPSLYDRDHAAWTTWSYVIVSVREGKSAGMRAWILREDRSGFDEEDIGISTDN
jgi:proteasome lid subunit RPN8/RPN11